MMVSNKTLLSLKRKAIDYAREYVLQSPSGNSKQNYTSEVKINIQASWEVQCLSAAECLLFSMQWLCYIKQSSLLRKYTVYPMSLLIQKRLLLKILHSKTTQMQQEEILVFYIHVTTHRTNVTLLSCKETSPKRKTT